MLTGSSVVYWWYVVEETSNSLWRSVHSFSFKQANIRPKDVLGSQYIVLRDGTVWQQFILNNLEECWCAWPSDSFLNLPSSFSHK
jgi:hypothetical protein